MRKKNGTLIRPKSKRPTITTRSNTVHPIFKLQPLLLRGGALQQFKDTDL